MTTSTDRTTQEGREFVAFRIGQQEFAIDIASVREIRGWTPETALPRGPGFVRGIINLRGTVLPIIDLASRLGLDASEPTPRHVIMVVQVGAQTFGLLVDAVSDIQTVEDAAIQPTPDVGAGLARQLVPGIMTVDGRMIALVALREVLPAAVELVAA